MKVMNLPLRAGAKPIIKVELVRRKMCEALKRWQYPTSISIDFTAVETSLSTPEKTQEASAEKKGTKETEAGTSGMQEVEAETEEKQTPTIESYMLDNIALFGIYKFVNNCPVLDRWELQDIISISFSKKINEATGTGTISLLYSKDRFKRIGQGDELRIYFGYRYPEDVLDPESGVKTREILSHAFTAFVAEVKKTKREIEINIADTGVILEQKKTFSYVDKTVKEILTDIIGNSGLKGIIKLGKKILETKVTLESESKSEEGGGSASGGHASGQFQNSCGRSDCPLPPSGSGRYVTCTTAGPCVCGATNFAYSRCPPDCNTNKCAGRGRGDTRQGGANQFPEGSFFCCSCDRDYCGCGTIHDGSHRRVLKTTCSSSSAGEAGSESGGESTSTQEMTLWDAIYKTLEKWEKDVHVYVKDDTVYIEEIKLPEQVGKTLVAWSDHNMIEESFDMTEGKAPIVSGIRINYANGKSQKKSNVIYDKDIDKYPETRYPGIVDVTWPEISGEDASLIGKKALREVQRVESSEAVSCDVLADPTFYPGQWVNVKNLVEDYNDYLYLTGISHKIQAGEFVTSLEMSLWKPPVSTTAGSGKEAAGGGDKAQFESILREAAKFGYCGGCSDANCLVRLGCGDCHAMSDYLFNRLSEAGFKVRILQYATQYSPRHRTVQIYQNGQWVDIPYREYGFNRLFNTTASRPGLFVYRQN